MFLKIFLLSHKCYLFHVNRSIHLILVSAREYTTAEISTLRILVTLEKIMEWSTNKNYGDENLSSVKDSCIVYHLLLLLLFCFLINNFDQSTVYCTQNEDYRFNSFSKELCPLVILERCTYSQLEFSNYTQNYCPEGWKIYWAECNITDVVRQAT